MVPTSYPVSLRSFGPEPAPRRDVPLDTIPDWARASAASGGRRVLTDNDEARRFIERSPKALSVFFHFPVYLRSAFPLTLGAMGVP